jgi:PilZ domain
LRKPEPRNHRALPRQPLAFDVKLLVSGQFPFRGKTRDVSLGGLFVETSAWCLPIPTEVHLALALPVAGATRHYRVPARMVRQTENGAGLTFTDVGIDTLHALRKAIYTRRQPGDGRALPEFEHP